MQLKRSRGALGFLDDERCVVQLDSRIESLTARQRDRPPAVDRPRMPAGPERFLEATSAQGAPHCRPLTHASCCSIVRWGQATSVGRYRPDSATWLAMLAELLVSWCV